MFSSVLSKKPENSKKVFLYEGCTPLGDSNFSYFLMKRFRSSSSSQENASYDIEGFHVVTQKKIAEGGYGVIYKCVDNFGNPHVLKIVQILDIDNRNQIMQEIVNQMQVSDHPNIVKLEGFFEADNEFRILMEYCEDSLINEIMKVLKTGFNTAKIAQIFSSILAAVKCLHEQNPPIIHRDLKPENILLKNGVWKLCDFGSSTTKVIKTEDISDSERTRISNDLAKNTTPHYRAPEMVDLFRGDTIGPASDIWALGCVLYKICTFKDAFPDGSNLEILNAKYNWNQAWNVDDYLKETVARCLASNPLERPTASQLEESFKNHYKDIIHPNQASAQNKNPFNNSLPVIPKSTVNQVIQQALKSAVNQNPFNKSTPTISKISPPQTQPTQNSAEYDYLTSLLSVKPPETDEISDESDIEVIDENVTTNKKEENNKLKEKPINAPVLNPFNTFKTQETKIEISQSKDSTISEEQIKPEILIENSSSEQTQSANFDILIDFSNKNSPQEIQNAPVVEQNEFSLNDITFTPDMIEEANTTEQTQETEYLNQNEQNAQQSEIEQEKQTEAQETIEEKKDFSDFGDVFAKEVSKPSNDYGELFKTNPNKLKEILVELNNFSLSGAISRIFLCKNSPGLTQSPYEFILGLARESGSTGTKILMSLPTLQNTPLENYLEARKTFCISYTMFEGNYSLHEFTEANRSSPPAPGNPPVSVNVVKMLHKILDLFVKAMRSEPSKVLAEDGYDGFQATSYIIAKLKQFKIQVEYINSTIIPFYKNLHGLMLKVYEQFQIGINFPKEPFNFEDPIVIKRLRAPQHKNVFQINH